jgi:hypothetical protein
MQADPTRLKELAAIIARLPPTVPLASADHVLAGLYKCGPTAMDLEDEDAGAWGALNQRTDAVWQGAQRRDGAEFLTSCVVRGPHGLGGMVDYLKMWEPHMEPGYIAIKAERVMQGIADFLYIFPASSSYPSFLLARIADTFCCK